MTSSSNDSRRFRLPFRASRTSLLWLSTLFVACGGSDCGCDGFIEQPYPPQHYDKTLPQGTQIRVTSHGLDFVEGNIQPLIEGALPEGLNFCLPKDTSSDTKLCFPYVEGRSGHHAEDEQPLCDDGQEGCQISLTIEGAEIRPVPNSSLEIDVLIGGLNPTIPFEADAPVIGEVKCDVTAYRRGGSINDPATVRAIVPVEFAVDDMSPTRDIRINVGEVGMNLDDIDFDLKGNWKCGTADFLRGLFRGTIEGLIRDELKNAVDDIVKENLCQTCTDGNTCGEGSTCDADDVCMYNNSSECVPVPLGVEGQLQLSSVIGDFVEEPNANVDTLFKVADFAQADTGLTLAARSGFQPVNFSECIPLDPTTRPSFEPIPISSTITGETKPGSGEPFMIGIGVHKSMIEHLLWSAWGSGGTCLIVDTRGTEQVSTGTLGIVWRSLRDLADGEARQAEIKIVPQTAPKLILGSNTVRETEDGYVVDDGLFSIDWKDLDMHVYAWVQDRWTRLATVRMDLLLPVAIVPDGGRLSVVLGDLEGGITNLRPRNSELLEENPDKVAELIPTLLGLALPMLADSLDLAFDLPEFVGLKIALGQGDITSVDDGTFIALFADLETATMPTNLRTLPEPRVLDWRVEYPNEPVFGEMVRPTVHLDVEGVLFGPVEHVLEAGKDVEFAYRVDGGFWSMYSKLGTLAIDDPVLALPGEHTIEVRARVAGESKLANRDQTARVVVSIDYQAPELELERDGDVLTFNAFDLTDSAADLRYRWRIHDGEAASDWSDWSATSRLELDELGLTRDFRVEAQVRDRSGKVTTDQQTVRVSALTPADDAPVAESNNVEPTAGCAQAPGGTNSNPALALLAAFGMVGLLRRRRAAAALFAGLLGIGASACTDDPTTSLQDCNPACASGESCKMGRCVADTPADECSSDSECTNGQLCEGNQCVEPECREDADCSDACGDEKRGVCNVSSCVCEDFCPEGCGDGEFCCFGDNACQALPDPCEGKVCEPGFEPGNPVAGEGDSMTCMVSGDSCDCVSLPPLPLGKHGRYPSVATNGKKTVIAAYNQTYGDLMVGVVEGEEIAWQFADGVPESGDIEGALDGPRGGIKDKGDNVGGHTAIAIDGSDNLHVFYRDNKEDTLKHAYGTPGADGYEFAISTLDDVGDTGYWTRAVIVDGTLHVVYQAASVPVEGGPQASQLKHFSAPAGQNLQGVEAAVVFEGVGQKPCADRCSGDDVCVESAGVCATPEEGCPADCGEGFACYQGGCEPVFNQNLPVAEPYGIGNLLDLSVTPSGLLVVFYDGVERSVAWTQFDGATWSMPQYAGAGTGPYGSAAIDGAGAVHVSYMTRDKTLVYEKLGEGGPEVIAKGLRDRGDEWLIARVGEGVKLGFGADGQPEVTYQDATLHTFNYASRALTGAWNVQVLGQPSDPYAGSHGFYSTMLRQADRAIAVEYVIDNQAEDPYAYPKVHTLP